MVIAVVRAILSRISTSSPTSLKISNVKLSVSFVVRGFLMEEYVNATGVPPNISESMLKMILSPLTVHVPELPCIVHVPPDKIYTSFVGNVTYTLLPAGIGFRES